MGISNWSNLPVSPGKVAQQEVSVIVKRVLTVPVDFI
jgi:hypothetical protein